MSNWLGKILGRFGREFIGQILPGAGKPSRQGKDAATTVGVSKTATRSDVAPAMDYPGDFTGEPAITYAPVPGPEADPGEIVWTWVPFEEDHAQGKDRPVLIIGRDDPWLLGVQLTSKDHDRDAVQEARQGRYWVDIGSGPWDPKRRPSEVRVNRIIRVDPAKVRRIGAVLQRERFDAVVAAIRG
ncbi:MAG: type II toxin-antitoxin system PemK/MazF family toxin [Propionibacteriaceae bacterium]|nr:type II toxin-antitoxin system PemK/MazF family toxin [Propionibacteriaceae bacterium]